jgi:CubicO group peptidase (beta-lactamase class C family)
MRNFLQTLFFFLLVTQICFAQLEFFNNEKQQKISSEQLTDAFTVNIDSLMLDSIIIAYMNSQSVPGITTLIIKDNEVAWNKNYGYRNLQFQLPVEDSTLFYMASISKTILATAVMQLWENGMIDLEGNINDYLPSGFTVVNPFFSNDTITVKMLMTHTSSLQDNWYFLDALWSCGDYPVTLDSFLVNYFTPGGAYYSQNNFYNYHPGQNLNYSNVGACLLALMVEHLSGKSFNEYTRDSIFTPLSMNSSSWFLSGLDTNKIATPYMSLVPMCHYGMAYWPVTQLRTNKFELSNFLSAYINGGVFNNNRILQSSTIEMMLTDQTNGQYPNWGQQGLLWYSDPWYDTYWGHTGISYGAVTDMFCNLSEKWGIIFFMNSDYTPNRPTPKMAIYAHFYGNIYALDPSVDKSYARQNIDSILFTTRFSNIHNHQFIPHLIYNNPDSTIIDSLSLFDDGLHGDSLANDGIYGNYIPPQQTENFYSLSVCTIDLQTNKYFNTPDICRFTTVGPVTLDSLYVVDHTTYFTVKPFVRNLSATTTITNASVRLICNDPWITSISPTSRPLPNIIPGAVVSSSSGFTVSVDSTFTDYFNFQVEVMSDGWTYWKDSLQIIVGVEEEPYEIPTEFSLSQNFPNPFNPSTTIKYSVPQITNVVIKVFDVLGSEVATLVNEEKPVGIYELTWNAEQLPSGVYFYQLKAGSFVETKKMLLLK